MSGLVKLAAEVLETVDAAADRGEALRKSLERRVMAQRVELARLNERHDDALKLLAQTLPLIVQVAGGAALAAHIRALLPGEGSANAG